MCHCKPGLLTMNFYHLHYFYEDVTKFRNTSVLDAAPYLHFRIFVKSIQKITIEKSSSNEGDLEGRGARSEKAKVIEGVENICDLSATDASRLNVLNVANPVLAGSFAEA